MFDEEYRPKCLADLWFLKGLIFKDLFHRYWAIVLWTTLVFTTSGSYLYFKGRADGVAHYKRSKNFMMTLDAAYKYGLWDCQDGKH
jgi:hypothetical protein